MNTISFRPGSIGEKHWNWAQICYPQLRKIFARWAGPQIITLRQGTFEEDTQRLGDLMLEVKALNWAVGLRVRDIDTFWDEKPARHFTVRIKHSPGYPSELDKIIAGAGAYYLYAWASKVDNVVKDWMIIDLCAWRERNLKPFPGWQCGYIKKPPFKFFWDMGPKIVIARSRSLKGWPL